MNRDKELGNWAWRDIQIELTAYECVMIHASLDKFLKETSSQKSDFFNESFIKEIDKYEFSTTYDVFSELIKNDPNIQKLIKHLHDEETNKSSTDGSLFSSFEDVSDIFNKGINLSIELRAIVIALKIHSKFESEDNYRTNNETSIFDSNDWSPPSTFANGTDDEREIWEDFQRSQNLRK
jgi:hypothetical protein